MVREGQLLCTCCFRNQLPDRTSSRPPSLGAAAAEKKAALTCMSCPIAQCAPHAGRMSQMSCRVECRGHLHMLQQLLDGCMQILPHAHNDLPLRALDVLANLNVLPGLRFSKQCQMRLLCCRLATLGPKQWKSGMRFMLRRHRCIPPPCCART